MINKPGSRPKRNMISGDCHHEAAVLRLGIPFFHVADYLFYAKCAADLYVPDMLGLEKRVNPREYQFLTTDGYYTIRCSKKCGQICL